MSAEITLFRSIAAMQAGAPQVVMDPVEAFNGDFTAPIEGVIRVYAKTADVLITMNNLSWTVPSGGVEYFGVRKDDEVGVA